MKLTNFRTVILFLSFCFTYATVKGQWLYTSSLEIHENEGVNHTNYPVAIDVDTKSLIEAGLMKTDGSDIRFSKACEDQSFLPYWLESGINTQHTIVWVKLQTLQANSKLPVFMHYGNATAVSASTRTGMFADSIIITASKSLTPIDTVFEADYIEVRSGTISLLPGHPGRVKFIGEFISINSSATLNGDGAGYLGGLIQQDGEGPGAGGGAHTELGGGGGGAGHGGMGGKGCGASAGEQGQGGQVAGTNNGLDIDRGSGGGGGDEGNGAVGGGVFVFKAQEITNSGTVTVKGIQADETASGAGGPGGGGAGGGILMIAKSIINKGKLDVSGGKGGGSAPNWPGGGGAGGRIKFGFQSSLKNEGSVIIKGGGVGTAYDPTDPPAEVGSDGYLSLINLNKVFNDTHPANLLTLNPYKDTITAGESLTITARGPYPNFDFFHNGELMQSGTDSVYATTKKVEDGDRFIVKNYEDGNTCILVSNPFIPVVTVVNIPPDAKDDAVAVQKNFVDFSIRVVDNDFDPNSNIDTAGIVLITDPMNGTAIFGSPGEVLYTPNTDFIGDDQFSYRVCDKIGACDSAIVYITVYDETGENIKPSVNPDNSSTLINTPDTIDVLSNDLDPDGTLDPSTLKITNIASNGSAQVEPGTGTIIYTPDNDFTGTDEFRYEVCDNGTPKLCDAAKVTVKVEPKPSSVYTSDGIEISVYPNPAREFIYVKTGYKLIEKMGIRLVDQLGREVYSHRMKQVPADRIMLDLPNLPSGFYLLQLELENSIQSTVIVLE